MSYLTIDARSGIRGSVTSSPLFALVLLGMNAGCAYWALGHLENTSLPTYVVQLSLCSV